MRDQLRELEDVISRRGVDAEVHDVYQLGGHVHAAFQKLAKEPREDSLDKLMPRVDSQLQTARRMSSPRSPPETAPVLHAIHRVLSTGLDVIQGIVDHERVVAAEVLRRGASCLHDPLCSFDTVADLVAAGLRLSSYALGKEVYGRVRAMCEELIRMGEVEQLPLPPSSTSSSSGPLTSRGAGAGAGGSAGAGSGPGSVGRGSRIFSIGVGGVIRPEDESRLAIVDPEGTKTKFACRFHNTFWQYIGMHYSASHFEDRNYKKFARAYCAAKATMRWPPIVQTVYGQTVFGLSKEAADDDDTLAKHMFTRYFCAHDGTEVSRPWLPLMLMYGVRVVQPAAAPASSTTSTSVLYSPFGAAPIAEAHILWVVRATTLSVPDTDRMRKYDMTMSQHKTCHNIDEWSPYFDEGGAGGGAGGGGGVDRREKRVAVAVPV